MNPQTTAPDATTSPAEPVPPPPFRAQRCPGADPHRLMRLVTVDLGTWSSTVVMHDNHDALSYVLDPDQRRRLFHHLVRVLVHPAVHPHAGTLVEKIQQRLAPVRGRFPDLPPLDDLPGITTAVQDLERTVSFNEERDRDKALRVAVTMGLEDLCAVDEDTATALIPLLDAAHDAAYQVPALREHNLWVRNIDDPRTSAEVRSILRLDPADLTSATLVDALVSDPPHRVVPGLKRFLLQPRALPELDSAALPQDLKPDTDVLLALAYLDLCERFETSLAEAGREKSPIRALSDFIEPSVREVMVTYPTSTPPSARRRLKQLLRAALGVSNVVTDYDEAAAAALFFLLREFGGDMAGGVPAFRSRARRVPDAAWPTWRLTMLVVDIGGGTTDIALLAVDLEDRSDPDDPGAAPESANGDPAGGLALRVEGRRYVLRPRVLGLTGHPQLGGDLITLKVFYWIKALLADDQSTQPDTGRREAEEPGSAPAGSLTERLLRNDSADPVPDDVRAELRRLVPTHTAPADGVPSAGGKGDVTGADGERWAVPRRRPEFDLFWKWAETAKQDALSCGDDKVIDPLEAGGEQSKEPYLEAFKSSGKSLTLDQGGFVRLIRPIVTDVVELAADLVRRCLAAEEAPVVDVVALSGRTTSMPQVQALLAETLLRELRRPDDGRGRAVEWEPTAMLLADSWSKQAAALGAAWAQSLSDFGQVHEDKLAIGRDTVTVQARNLLLTLPNDFGFAGASGAASAQLRAGSALDLCNESGDYFIRSPWTVAMPTIDLHRVMGPYRSQEWGHLLLRELLPPNLAAVPPDLFFSIDLDTASIPRIHLHQGVDGRPRPLLHPLDGYDLGGAGSISLRSLPALRHLLDGAGRLSRVPRILAAPCEGGTGDPVEVLAPAAATERLDVDVAVDGELPTGVSGPGVATGTPGLAGWHDSRKSGPAAGLRSGRCAAAVSDRSLPLVGDTELPADRYQLWVQADPDTEPVDAGVLDVPRVPDEMGTTHDHVPAWLLLTEDGTVRLHHGYPPFFRAADLADALENPGWVFSAWMDNRTDGLSQLRDPFTGDH